MLYTWYASGDALPFEHGWPIVAMLIMGVIAFASIALTQLIGWMHYQRADARHR